MLCVVKRAVQQEDELRNYAELFCNQVSKLPADGFVVFFQKLHHAFLFIGREYAHEDFGYGKVRTYADFAYRYQGAAEGRHSLGSDYFRKVLLDFTGNLQLPCTCLLFHNIAFRWPIGVGHDRLSHLDGRSEPAMTGVIPGLTGNLFYIDDEVILLAFLGKDVVAVHDIGLGYCGFYAVHFVFVDCDTVALDHFAGLAF